MTSVRTITYLDRLERGAARVGWRLVWSSAPSFAHSTLLLTELWIYDGNRLVTADGPAWLLHPERPDLGEGWAREKIAGMVLDAMPRRGDAAN